MIDEAVEVDALEVISDANIQIGKFKLAKTGLIISGTPTYDEWYKCGTFLTQAEKAIQFWIGDWVNYGEKKYGETYAQAIDETGLEYQTVANAKYVADHVEFSRRRENLSFDHHASVAAQLPEAQDKLLDDAEALHLNVRDFRDHVRQYKQAIEPAQALPTSRHSVIYADPPWQYDFSVSDSREIENQYPTMPVQDICALPIAGIAAADCVMFMWATSPKLTEAMQVIESWGFTYKTCMVWVKDKIGMGYYARQKHELLLIATQGSLPTPEPSNRPASVIEAPRGVHSQKPEVVYELLEKMYPNQSKIELFSRNPRAGWKAWGNQA